MNLNNNFGFGNGIGTADLTGYVPYTGATQNLNLGSFNLYVNNVFSGFTSVAASATLITLTVNSTPYYLVTGSGGQTIKLPDATTLSKGALFNFNNNQSSGAILVNNNSNTLVKSVPSGGSVIIELIDNSIAAGSWDAHSQAPSNVSWSTNTFDYAGSITSATWNGVNVALNRGGTGANTAAGARTNLGSTTVGDSFFTLANPSAITFPQINANNTVSALSASDFRTAIGAGTFTLPSLTSGSVLFSNGITISQDNTNFFWDNTNKRLGIGTTTPAAAISLLGSSTGSIRYRTENSNSAGLADYIAYNSSSNYIQMIMIGSTFANFANYGKIEVGGSPAGLLLNLASGTGFLDLATNTVVGFRMFANNGNTICIQNGGTFTDSGDRVQITGNLNLKGVGNKIKIATGSNASIGTSSAMTAGTITIMTSAVTASSKIILTNASPAGTIGVLSIGTIVANTSFIINSSSALDTSTVNWWIIN